MVNLLDWLPPYLREYREIKELAQAEVPELELLQSNVNRLRSNQYIHSCDDAGIARFEQLLKITPALEDSVDERINRVLNRWNEDIPYTYKGLVRKLNLLFGEGNYTIKLHHKHYKLVIEVFVNYESQIDEIKYFLSYMIPANIVVNLDALRRVGQTVYLQSAVNKLQEAKVTIKPKREEKATTSFFLGYVVRADKHIKVNIPMYTKSIVGTFRAGRRLSNDI